MHKDVHHGVFNIENDMEMIEQNMAELLSGLFYSH